MIKPDWNIAPDWANYYAEDYDGLTYWYMSKPTVDTDTDSWDSNERCAQQWSPCDDWKDSLQKRP